MKERGGREGNQERETSVAEEENRKGERERG